MSKLKDYRTKPHQKQTTCGSQEVLSGSPKAHQIERYLMPLEMGRRPAARASKGPREEPGPRGKAPAKRKARRAP